MPSVEDYDHVRVDTIGIRDHTSYFVSINTLTYLFLFV